MENSILNSFPVDPGIFLIVLLILNMILIIVTIRCTFYYKRLYRGYDVFMRGKDAETLEDTIMNLVEYTEEIGAQNESINRRLKEAFSDVSASYQKTGIVKYNALKGMGGNLSFCLTPDRDTAGCASRRWMIQKTCKSEKLQTEHYGNREETECINS